MSQEQQPTTMMTMKPDRILEHECLERLRREVRRNAWHGYVMHAMVLLVCVVVLWWVMPPAWREAVMEWVTPLTALTPVTAVEPMRAGFGVPEWVAYGLVMTVVLMLMGLKAWQCIVTVGEPLRDEEPVETAALEDPRWMLELMAYFQRRGVVLSRAHCWALRARAEGRGAPGMVPDERLPLLLLDAWVREHLKLRLFVSTLQEVQAICLEKGVAA